MKCLPCGNEDTPVVLGECVICSLEKAVKERDAIKKDWAEVSRGCLELQAERTRYKNGYERALAGLEAVSDHDEHWRHCNEFVREAINEANACVAHAKGV